MATDYQKIRVLDPRLACSDKIKYAVEKGGMNVTYAQYKAVSATTNTHTFNINVPSQETIIAREVYWKCTVNLRVKLADPTPNEYPYPNALPMQYGRCESFGPFPLNSCVNTMSTTINNNTMTVNLREIFPALLRLLSVEQLQKYESTCPTMIDRIADYNSFVQYDLVTLARENTPVRPTTTSADKTTPYGERYTLVGCQNGYTTATSYPANPLGSATTASFDGLKPRGSFKVLNIQDYNGGTPRPPDETTTDFLITAEFMEPLLMSPWLYGGGYASNCAGIYGIQNMNFQFTIGSPNRMWRYANGNQFGNINATGLNWNSAEGWQAITKEVSFPTGNNIEAFVDSQLIFCFLTPHASNLLPPRNVVPYLDLPVYKTNGFAAFPPVANNRGALKFEEVSIISTSLQLNQIPDALIIYVKPSNYTNADPDYFLCIKNVQISFNNQAGLLVNATQQDLWRISVSNGSNQTWEEFSGSMTGTRPYKTVGAFAHDILTSVGNKGALDWNGDEGTTVPSAPLKPSPNLVGQDLGVPFYSHIPGSGSVLILKFAKDLQLVEDYYSAGSLGNFNLQVRCTVYNQTWNPIPQGGADLCIITKNSGILVTERGSSSLYTGLLTKQDVMDANEEPYFTGHEYARMVGGGFLDHIKTAGRWLWHHGPGLAKHALGKIHETTGHEMAKKGHDVLHALGYGKGKKSLEDRVV